MQWNWFDLHWAWIGLGLAAVLLILLMGTNVFRANLTVSRWRDPFWLAWLAPAAYMIHQFEEYGIDAQGLRFAFPDVLCGSQHMPPYPACGLPTGVFVAINIPAIWAAGLICGLLARRHPLVGLGVYAIHFTNALSHLGVAIASHSYNPGSLTAALIQLPSSLWVGFVCFGPGKLPRRGIFGLVLGGTVMSVMLLVGVHGFATGHFSKTTLLLIEILNPLFVIIVPWLFEKSGHSQQTGRPLIQGAP